MPLVVQILASSCEISFTLWNKLRQELESLKRKAAKMQEKLNRHIQDDATMSGGLMKSEDDDDIVITEIKIKGKIKEIADERIKTEGNRYVLDRIIRSKVKDKCLT